MPVNDITDMTSFKWATVTAAPPSALAIRMDGDTNPLALVPDSLVDPLELFVGARVRVELSIRKVVIHGVANGGAFSGEIKIIAQNNVIPGWLVCDGSSLLRTSYPRLFAAIGTQFGAADGTHFNLPDLRGKVVAGIDTTQTEFNARGKVGGEKTHLQTIAEMPAHNHPFGYSGSPTTDFADWGLTAVVPGGGSVSIPQGTPSATNRISIRNTGGGTAFNVLQPYMALNYIIKT
jgi:microcystin-dependent protein